MLRRLIAQIRSSLRVAAFLRHPIASSAGFEVDLRARLERREQHFLWSVENLIFANPGSPYRPLLELAGYDLAKVKQLVEARGLDTALDQLRQDGVYVRIQEFKSGEPTVRRGRTFRFRERDFANPSAYPLVHTRTSGSRSRGTRIGISTEDLLHHARLRLWLHENYGLRNRDVVIWATPGTGLQSTLEFLMWGRSARRWFSPVRPGRLAGLILIAITRQPSRPLALSPVVVPADRVLEVARYISRMNAPRGILVETLVSSALRLVLAAEEAGIALGDVTFTVTGEPVTPIKRQQIEARGFQVWPRFAFNELGRIAWACPMAQWPDDVHVMTDMVAVRQYSRVVDEVGGTVPAYLFTSLLPHARHVMVNMETGDYGGLEERSCGCFLERAGLRLHMHTIRSFEKLTAEGITFVGPTLVELVEEILPRQFGGDSRHYQLVEGEDGRGFTRLYVLVSPQLGPLDEEALRETVLREIAEHHSKGAYGRVVEQVWRDADTVRVLRRDPLQTTGGKILHLHRERGALALGAEGPEEGTVG